MNTMECATNALNSAIENTLSVFMADEYNPQSSSGKEGELINKLFYDINDFRIPLFDYNPDEKIFHIDFYREQKEGSPHISLKITNNTIMVEAVGDLGKTDDLTTLKKLVSNEKEVLQLKNMMRYTGTVFLSEYEKNCKSITKGGRRSHKKSHKKNHKKTHKKNHKKTLKRR